MNTEPPEFGSPEDIEQLLEGVAKRVLGVDTFTTQNSSKDFKEVAVWQIKEAMLEAYKLGMGDIRLHKR